MNMDALLCFRQETSNSQHKNYKADALTTRLARKQLTRNQLHIKRCYAANSAQKEANRNF